MKQETDKHTWRLKSWETDETHQFVSSTIFDEAITFPTSLSFPSSKDHYFKGTKREIPLKQINVNLLSSIFQMSEALVSNYSEIEIVIIISSLLISYWSQNNMDKADQEIMMWGFSSWNEA